MGGVWEGKEGWTGMVRNHGPCSRSLEAGIIPPSEPSPDWLVSRLAFSFRLGPWYRRYSFLGVAGLFPGVFWLFIELLVMVGQRTDPTGQMGRIHQYLQQYSSLELLKQKSPRN